MDLPADQEASIADSVSFSDLAIPSNQAHDPEDWKAELVRVVDAARHDSNNAAQSLASPDGALSQPAFLQRLTALEILKLRRVCSSWADWFRDNIAIITSARRQDDNRDWYFPVFNPVIQNRTASSLLPSWPLSGIWHATADHSSEELQVHELPPLAFPPGSSQIDCRQPRYDVIASSGGLLLVQMLPSCTTRKRRRGVVESIGCRQSRDGWPSLMVMNPVTKKLRVLPAFEGTGLHRSWNSNFYMQGQIMVDDEENAYKVLLYTCSLRTFHVYDSVHILTGFYVYDSRSGSWHYEHRIPAPMTEPEFGAMTERVDVHYYASACVRRRLYFADVRRPTATDWQINTNISGVIRLLEMDIDTKDWKPCKYLPLIRLLDLSVEIQGVCRWDLQPRAQSPARYVLRNLELVECMGHIFAVIPARIDEFVHPWKGVAQSVDWMVYDSAPDVKHLPLQFYVFQLDGEDVADGVVRIEVPTARKGCACKSRRQSLWEKSLVVNQRRIQPERGQGNWFSCTAKGSVIWVSCEDYLVQYDVLSRQSKTQIIPKVEHHRGFAYRASFHMKP